MTRTYECGCALNDLGGEKWTYCPIHGGPFVAVKRRAQRDGCGLGDPGEESTFDVEDDELEDDPYQQEPGLEMS